MEQQLLFPSVLKSWISSMDSLVWDCKWFKNFFTNREIKLWLCNHDIHHVSPADRIIFFHLLLFLNFF